MDRLTCGLIHCACFHVCHVVYRGAIKSSSGEAKASLLNCYLILQKDKHEQEPCNYTSTGGLCNHQSSRSEGKSWATEDCFFDNLQGGSGGDNECGSSAVALPHPPFPRPRVTLYLIFCFLLSVTAEPSWCVVACCQDCAFKPEEFQPERQRVKASVAGMKSLGESRKRRTKKNSSWQPTRRI